MTKEQFIELIGEHPENMFGEDWENTIEELSYNKDKPYDFVSDWQNGDWPCGKRRAED